MRIAVVNVQVPFVRGGAELLADGLVAALARAGHETCLVTVPFNWYPPARILDHVLACRLLDLSAAAGAGIDRVVGLKFPAYLVPHPAKVLWLVHQHRAAYDLWDHSLGDLVRHPDGAAIRDAVLAADLAGIPEARALYAISDNVARRLRLYCGLEARPLYHPPPGEGEYASLPAEDYLFFPSRLWPTKRQALVLAALGHTREPVAVRFAGAPDAPAYLDELKARAADAGVAGQVEWLGQVSAAAKLRLYAACVGVVYPPADEDYGYVTLEAMLAGKPVVTTSDAGGALEFVRHGDTGLVADPTPEALAAALDRLWSDRAAAARMGAAGRARYHDLGISWPAVVAALTAEGPG